MVGDAEAELPEAELEGGVTELVLFGVTLEEVMIVVAEVVEDNVAIDEAVVFVELDESK